MTVSSSWKTAPPSLFLGLWGIGVLDAPEPSHLPRAPSLVRPEAHMAFEFLRNPCPDVVPCPHGSPLPGRHGQSSSLYSGMGLPIRKTGAEQGPDGQLSVPFDCGLIPPDLGVLDHGGPVGRSRGKMLAQQWGESKAAHLIFLVTGDGI